MSGDRVRVQKSEPPARKAAAHRPVPLAPRLVSDIESIRASSAHSLDGVRLHAGPRVHAISETLGAEGFTVGRHVFLGAFAGSETLRHELRHTQQASDRPSLQGLAVVPDASPLEQSINGSARPLAALSGPPLLFRKPKGNGAVLPRATAPQGKAPVGAKDVSKASGKEAAKEGGQGASAGPAAGAVHGAVSAVPDGAQATEGPAETAPIADAAALMLSPESDPAFQGVAARVRGTAGRQKQNPGGAAVAHDAQKAANSPIEEREGQAKAAQVEAMAKEKANPFGADAFKDDLRKKIDAMTPRSEEEGKAFMKDENTSKTFKADLNAKVTAEKSNAAGSLPEAVAAAPSSEGLPERKAEALEKPEAGPPPAGVKADAAVPPPRPESQFDLSAPANALGTRMVEAKVSDAQLQNANEPTFLKASQGVAAVKEHAEAAPADLRAKEQGVLGAASQEQEKAGAGSIGAMTTARGKHFAQATTHQAATKTKDEQERERITTALGSIYERTKADVTSILETLDTKVNKFFESEAERYRDKLKLDVEAMMRSYEDERYSQSGGTALFLWDAVTGMPAEVSKFWDEGRKRYLNNMNLLIDEVAGMVEKGLKEATDRIAAGKQAVTNFVTDLPVNLRKLGEEAAQAINGQFEGLTQLVSEQRDKLLDSLATKYVDSLKQVDTYLAAKKEENKGLLDTAKEALDGVIDTIKKLKDMLLGVLQRAKNAIDLILEDPIRFLGNLAEGVKRGLFRFIDNIAKHLQAGLLGWLFGALAEAGIDLPQTFDLRGILSLILQVLGLTYRNIRARAVKILGEKIVSALESTAEVFLILVNEGPAGLIKFLKEKVEALKETMMEQIRTFVTEKIIVAGIKWIIGLLNPAGAFIKACMAIYDIVMFFVNSGQRIMALVNAVIDSVTNIAQGNLEGAASWIENALAKGVPIAISFLASLLGLDGIGKKIQQIIEKIQAPINLAIDWLIRQAVKLVQAAGKAFAGMFGSKPKEDQKKGLDDPTGVKAIAQAKIIEHADSLSGYDAWQAFISRLEGELKPQGLKRLYIDDSEDASDDELPRIMAEASMTQEVARVKAEDRHDKLKAEPDLKKRRMIWRQIKSKQIKDGISEKIGEEQMVKYVTSQGYVKVFSPGLASEFRQGFDAVYENSIAVVVCEAKGKRHRGDPTPAKSVQPTELKGNKWPESVIRSKDTKTQKLPYGHVQGSVGWAREAGKAMLNSSITNTKEKKAAKLVDEASATATPGGSKLKLRTLVFLAKHTYGVVSSLEYQWRPDGP